MAESPGGAVGVWLECLNVKVSDGRGPRIGKRHYVKRNTARCLFTCEVVRFRSRKSSSQVRSAAGVTNDERLRSRTCSRPLTLSFFSFAVVFDIYRDSRVSKRFGHAPQSGLVVRTHGRMCADRLLLQSTPTPAEELDVHSGQGSPLKGHTTWGDTASSVMVHRKFRAC